MHIAFRTLVWSLLGLGLALALVMVRLSAGPIELGWLQPRIERALAPDDGAIAASAGRIELRLDTEERTLELVGVDVSYRVADGGDALSFPFLMFPEVELTLSVEALLQRGMIAASEVSAKAPSLVITQDEDGIIRLLSETDYDGRTDEIDFGAFLSTFALASDPDGRLAFLERLQISGGHVAYYDRPHAAPLAADNADLVLTRREGGVDGWLRADVAQPSRGPASVQLAARLEPNAEHIAFEADIADLMPADLPAIWLRDTPALAEDVRGLRLPTRASIGGEIGLDGTLSPLTVEIEAAPGTVHLPAYFAKPLEITAAAFRGEVSADLGAVEIDHAAIVSRGAELIASGGIVWRGNERSIALDLAASGVRAEDLPAFWPLEFGKKSRKWVVENIETGLVTTAEATIDLKPGDWGAPERRKDAVDGSFLFEGLSVRYVDEMPPLENASGRAAFDADRIDFEVNGGTDAGVTLNGGSVTITGMSKPGRLTKQLHVVADAEGSIEQALAVLDHPPLEVARELGIAPSEAAGRVTATIDVRMPLYDGVTAEEAVVLAEAELTGLAIDRLPKLGDDVRLDEGTFELVVDEQAVRLDGRAAVNGVPLQIDVVEARDEEGGAPRRIGLRGSLGRQQLQSLGMTIDEIDGRFDFEALVTETSSNFWVDLEADLADLAIAPPGLAWRKAAGQAGMLRASIAVPVDGPVAVKAFDIQTDDLQASGSLSMSSANDRLQSLTIDSFRLPGTDAAFRLSPDDEGGVEIEIEAERLDLDALFGADRDGDEAFRRFHVVLRADRLILRGVELLDARADALQSPDGWRTASLIGTLPSGGGLVLELTPDGDDRRLQVRTDDAGALIEALDLGQRLEGGKLLLTARVASQDPVIASGRLDVGGFVLQDAPLLARMLTLASLTGIGNLLEGEGIQVDQLILPFTLDDRTLRFEDGLMRGSEIGVTVKGDVELEGESFNLAGTIIPVYTLNRLIGQVPVIGRILTGVDGRGAFAATYSISGPQDDPTVYVNPLSIITPGLIRDFVGGLLNGTGEPAEAYETDD